MAKSDANCIHLYQGDIDFQESTEKVTDRRNVLLSRRPWRMHRFYRKPAPSSLPILLGKSSVSEDDASVEFCVYFPDCNISLNRLSTIKKISDTVRHRFLSTNCSWSFKRKHPTELQNRSLNNFNQILFLKNIFNESLNVLN